MGMGGPGGFGPGGGAMATVGSGPMMGAQESNNPPATPTPAAATPVPAAVPAATRPDAPASTTLAATNPDETSAGASSKTITLAQALTDLQTALADSKTTTEQLKEKMEVVRDAREKTKLDMETARKELLLLLTTDQEATLVGMGLLQ
jgi:hypothetical protein